MPSPFPGMDPYLEHPARWPGVHAGLIPAMQAALNASLPPAYVADLGERLYVVAPERSIYPDLAVVERLPPERTLQTRGGGTAVLEASDPVWVFSALPEERREPYIQIVMTGNEEQIVTVIELLSPSNKAAGSPGRPLYLTKQEEILRSPIHLLEIDLLRQGEHTVAPPRESLLQRGDWTYLVSLRRASPKPQFEVWPIQLRQRLPRVRVPLSGEDPDVVLDLQACFNRRYDEAASARRLNYQGDPVPPLEPDDAEWADRLLRESGLRP